MYASKFHGHYFDQFLMTMKNMAINSNILYGFLILLAILAMIPNQWPSITFKGIDNLVLMAITFTLLYVHFCPLFQNSVTRASFSFSFRRSNDQQGSCWTIIKAPFNLKN